MIIKSKKSYDLLFRKEIDDNNNIQKLWLVLILVKIMNWRMNNDHTSIDEFFFFNNIDITITIYDIYNQNIIGSSLH